MNIAVKTGWWLSYTVEKDSKWKTEITRVEECASPLCWNNYGNHESCWNTSYFATYIKFAF